MIYSIMIDTTIYWKSLKIVVRSAYFYPALFSILIIKALVI